MRYFTLLYILSMAGLTCYAQELPEDLPVADTPRQKIVDEIGKSTSEQDVDNPDVDNIVSEILLGLRGANESETEDASQPDVDTEETEIFEEVVEETPKQEIAKEEITESDDTPPALAPFYLSAEEYLAVRGDDKHDQIVLDYEITTSALEGTVEPRIEDIQLIIGPDYVSVKGTNSQKIYDFKMNRFLEIRPVKTLDNDTDTALHIDNISLYAKAYRNISTVRRATQNGQKRRIPIAEDREIDSFWLESSMSWAAAKLESPLKIKSTKSNVLAIWDEMSVLSASFDGEAYNNQEFKNALMAFAHHSWPIHPKILIELYAYDSPPKNLEMVSYGPTQPKGQTQKWSLEGRELIEASFPIPVSALSATERRPISPLVFVISEAVKDRAMGGIASRDDLEAAFDKAATDGDKLDQWLIGQRYNAYFGNCEKDDKNDICEALNELAETKKFAAIGAIDPDSKTLSDFIGATEMAKFKKNRSTALFTLQPYLDDADTPAFILRTAAMARASMKKKDADKSGMGSIQAESLLKQALAKDPYDPHTYLGLAQVYAAKGAFEQSWDIYDTLRAAIPTVEAITPKIDQAESNLLLTGPGYFLQK